MKNNQEGLKLGIGEFRAKPVQYKKSAPHGNTGVGARANSVPNDKK